MGVAESRIARIVIRHPWRGIVALIFLLLVLLWCLPLGPIGVFIPITIGVAKQENVQVVRHSQMVGRVLPRTVPLHVVIVEHGSTRMTRHVADEAEALLSGHASVARVTRTMHPHQLGQTHIGPTCWLHISTTRESYRAVPLAWRERVDEWAITMSTLPLPFEEHTPIPEWSATSFPLFAMELTVTSTVKGYASADARFNQAAEEGAARATRALRNALARSARTSPRFDAPIPEDLVRPAGEEKSLSLPATHDAPIRLYSGADLGNRLVTTWMASGSLDESAMQHAARGFGLELESSGYARGLAVQWRAMSPEAPNLLLSFFPRTQAGHPMTVVLFQDQVPPAKYAELARRFLAEDADSDLQVDLAHFLDPAEREALAEKSTRPPFTERRLVYAIDFYRGAGDNHPLANRLLRIAEYHRRIYLEDPSKNFVMSPSEWQQYRRRITGDWRWEPEPPDRVLLDLLGFVEISPGRVVGRVMSVGEFVPFVVWEDDRPHMFRLALETDELESSVPWMVVRYFSLNLIEVGSLMSSIKGEASFQMGPHSLRIGCTSVGREFLIKVRCN